LKDLRLSIATVGHHWSLVNQLKEVASEQGAQLALSVLGDARGTLVAEEILRVFWDSPKAQWMDIKIAALHQRKCTWHLTISLSRVKQKSHRGCFSFSRAFSTDWLITSFSKA
jgi:hypothetical protein